MNPLSLLFENPLTVFIVGVLLVVAFLWYLSAEKTHVRRWVGSFSILGLSAFSLASLLHNGMHYGIDISGGVELTLEVQPKLNELGQLTPPDKNDMEQACEILNQRLNATGTSEVQILHTGNKILIQIPETDPAKSEALVKTLTKMARLELLTVHPDSENLLAQHENRVAEWETGGKRGMRPTLPTDYMRLPHPLTNEETGEPLLGRDGKAIVSWLLVQKPYVAIQKGLYITGKDVSGAQPDYTRKGYVNVVLSGDGASRMRHLTGPMIKGRDRLAVVLNGQVKCAPVVNDTLGKEFSISGLDGRGEAEDISKALANPLTSDLKVLGLKQVSAQLGQGALQKGEISGIIGMALIFIFCFWYYYKAGMVAMVGLALNALFLLGLMSLFGFVLTLPGIAGIVLTMGTAVDANVLIYERMREERRAGLSFLPALRKSYEKAFSAIFDSNITSLLTALILFWMASGSIKGFAVTTSVGICTSMLGALVVTRILFYWCEHLGIMRDSRFNKAPLENTSFNFMRFRRTAGLISLLVILIGLGYSIFGRGSDALGIDFTGGTAITYTIPRGEEGSIDYTRVEETVRSLPLSKVATVQQFHNNASSDNIKINCATPEDAELVLTSLKDIPSVAALEAPSQESISAALGSTFLLSSAIALLAGIAGIMVYLAFRFEWSFALGAIIAIAHDELAIIGLVILMGGELSIIHIGAFLTVAGYSINDTIVIYDRIREQLALDDASTPLSTIINEAINSTLPRTLLTSLSTLAALVALLLFGGPAMHDFSLTMLLGVLVGTYSSIFIAAPIVALFYRKAPRQKDLSGRNCAKTPDGAEN